MPLRFVFAKPLQPVHDGTTLLRGRVAFCFLRWHFFFFESFKNDVPKSGSPCDFLHGGVTTQIRLSFLFLRAVTIEAVCREKRTHRVVKGLVQFTFGRVSGVGTQGGGECAGDEAPDQ